MKARLRHERWCIDSGPAGYLSGVDALTLILLLLGAVFFGLATFGVAARINLVAAGLLCWILTALIPAVAAL